jgi:hypothetical protein
MHNAVDFVRGGSLTDPAFASNSLGQFMFFHLAFIVAGGDSVAASSYHYSGSMLPPVTGDTATGKVIRPEFIPKIAIGCDRYFDPAGM